MSVGKTPVAERRNEWLSRRTLIVTSFTNVTSNDIVVKVWMATGGITGCPDIHANMKEESDCWCVVEHVIESIYHERLRWIPDIECKTRNSCRQGIVDVCFNMRLSDSSNLKGLSD